MRLLTTVVLLFLVVIFTDGKKRTLKKHSVKRSNAANHHAASHPVTHSAPSHPAAQVTLEKNQKTGAQVVNFTFPNKISQPTVALNSSNAQNKVPSGNASNQVNGNMQMLNQLTQYQPALTTGIMSYDKDSNSSSNVSNQISVQYTPVPEFKNQSFKDPGQMTKVDRDMCLKAHNKARSFHGAPPMKWDDKLAKKAKKWADKLMREDKLKNEPNASEGENIFMYYGPRPKRCADAVLKWYQQKEYYNFFNGEAKKKGKSVDRFTQLVWKGNQKVGVGIASQFEKQVYGINYYKTYVVAKYYKGGNKKGKYVTSVLPLKPGVAPPELEDLDPTLCEDAVGTETCDYYEHGFNIPCKANSWENFMMDACYRKCSECAKNVG